MSGEDEARTPPEGRQPEPRRPLLRVVKGDPTAEEIASLVAVLAARAAAAAPQERPRRSEWAGHERRMRRPVHPSPGGWRASALPR